MCVQVATYAPATLVHSKPLKLIPNCQYRRVLYSLSSQSLALVLKVFVMTLPMVVGR